jgi:hypothetical protein
MPAPITIARAEGGTEPVDLGWAATAEQLIYHTPGRTSSCAGPNIELRPDGSIDCADGISAAGIRLALGEKAATVARGWPATVAR